MSTPKVKRIEEVPQGSGERRLRLDLAYDGSGFHGWQEQANAVTVAGTLRGVLERILGHPVNLVGAGRTDSGVHALGQVAHFDTAATRSVEAITVGLRGLLPRSIRVLAVRSAPAGFHARYRACLKEYRYQIWDAPQVLPFLEPYAWWWRTRLDDEAMGRAASSLVGTRDLTSFQASGCVARSAVRTLVDASLARSGSMLVIRLVSRGFLRHMARNIAGALFEIGRGRLDPAGLTALIEARDRTRAPLTAPARGLFLVRVAYDGEPEPLLESPPEPVVTCRTDVLMS